MVTRYERDDEVVPLALKRLARGVANANRATGTEIRQTADTADRAAEDSQFARDLAEQLESELGSLPDQVQDAIDEAQAATQAAADAQTAANGKSTVVRSPSEPTAAGSYKQGDQWWQFDGADIVGLWLHDGAGWKPQTLTGAIIAELDAGKITTGVLAADRIAAGAITAAKIAAGAVSADKIAAGAVSADKIAAGAITAAKIAAGAIDGITVTGAQIRTAPSGQRFELDVSGLRAYDSSGAVSAVMTPGVGSLQVNGAVRASNGFLSDSATTSSRLYQGGFTHAPHGSNAGASIGMQAPDQRFMTLSVHNDAQVKMYAQPLVSGAEVRQPNAGLRLRVEENTASKLWLDSDLQVGVAGTDRQITYHTRQRFEIDPEYASDRDWMIIDDLSPGSPKIATLGSGVMHNNAAYYTGMQARIKSGVLYITGSLTRASWPANQVCFTLVEEFRPPVAVVQYAYAGGHNFVYYDPTTGQVKLAVTGNGRVVTFGMTFPL